MTEETPRYEVPRPEPEPEPQPAPKPQPDSEAADEDVRGRRPRRPYVVFVHAEDGSMVPIGGFNASSREQALLALCARFFEIRPATPADVVRLYESGQRVVDVDAKAPADGPGPHYRVKAVEFVNLAMRGVES